MNINVLGAGKKRGALLTEATEFFAYLLMDPRMVRNLEIDIDVLSNLDVQGECVNEDDTRNPRYFTISLKRIQDEDIIKTLAHEMVHVKQYAKNELSKQLRIATRGGVKISTKWQGEFWKPKRKEHDYFDAPWEVEAYGKEIGLYHRWVEHKGNVK